MKKKIIYITTLLPYPKDMGGKIKTYSTLKMLTKNDDVYLFSFIDKKEDIVYEKELRNIGIKKCITIVNPVISQKHRLTQFAVLFKSIFSSKPYSVYKYSHGEMFKKINKLLKNEKIDIVWVDHTIQSQYFPKNFRGLKILETHNFKTDFFKKMFSFEKSIFYKFFSFYEWFKFRFYEPGEFNKANLILTISDDEKRKIEKFNENVRVLFPEIKVTDNIGKFESKRLFFVGLLTWYPNKQGISWFVNEVFPDLSKVIPEITLEIVGDYSLKWKPPKHPQVRFHGYAKDLKSFWSQASVFIVPLKYGSGIRIKILEALAHGLPVVSTSAGADGLPDFIKNKIFISDDKNEMIKIIENLLNNKKLYIKSVEAGKNGLRRLETLNGDILQILNYEK